jgi:hypothetical protein
MCTAYDVLEARFFSFGDTRNHETSRQNKFSVGGRWDKSDARCLWLFLLEAEFDTNGIKRRWEVSMDCVPAVR